MEEKSVLVTTEKLSESSESEVSQKAGKKTFRNPWAWVPSLYFAEGIPYATVNLVSIAMYRIWVFQMQRLPFIQVG